MDSLLWFREKIVEVDDKSHGQKLVPWLSWDEWELVRTSLFSNSPESIAFALDRIAAWRSRGCLPVTVEVTASIIKIQQKDPVFRAGSSSDASDDEEILAMLYSMAVMRLVNGLIEKTRRRSEVSIAEAAAKIDMPRMLIDIRHEASHRELPSLHLLRQASTEALNWLKSFYWDSQKTAIPFRGGENSSVREEISSKLHQLVLDLKKKQNLRLHSSDIKEKRGKKLNQLCGRNKLCSQLSSKVHPSQFIRSRKQVTRTLKSLVNLYAFFSSEVTSLLLEFLLGVPEPLNMVEFPAKFQDALSLDVAQTAFDKWKPVITKFSKKEPELLLSLLNAVVDMIEGRRAMRDDLGQKHFSLSVYDAETCQIGVLSSLFSWLVEILKALRSLYPDDSESITDKNASVLPKSILLELLHRCLLISESGNNALFSSALLLAELVGNSHLNHKPNKLSLLCSLPYLDFSKDNDSSAVDPEKLVYREKDFQQASEKVELLKRRRLNCSSSQATSSSTGSTSKWTVVGSWKPCPIGMLPRALGTSGCLPVLDCKNEQKETVASMSRKEEKETLSSIDNERLIEVSNMGNNENQEAGNGSGKRKSSCEVDEVSNPLPKRFQGAAAHNDDKNAANVDDNKEDTWMDWSEGRLFINGVFKKVEEEELKRIQSRIRILVRIPGHLNTDRKLVTQNPYMLKTLEKYQKCNYGAPDTNVVSTREALELSSQQEYLKLKARYDSLQRTHRNLLGEDLGPLNTRELESLEKQLDMSLKQIRTTRTQMMLDQLHDLQRREHVLQEANRDLKHRLLEVSQSTTLQWHTNPGHEIEYARQQQAQPQPSDFFQPLGYEPTLQMGYDEPDPTAVASGSMNNFIPGAWLPA